MTAPGPEPCSTHGHVRCAGDGATFDPATGDVEELRRASRAVVSVWRMRMGQVRLHIEELTELVPLGNDRARDVQHLAAALLIEFEEEVRDLAHAERALRGPDEVEAEGEAPALVEGGVDDELQRCTIPNLRQAVAEATGALRAILSHRKDVDPKHRHDVVEYVAEGLDALDRAEAMAVELEQGFSAARAALHGGHHGR